MDAVKFLANPIVTLVIGCVVTVIFAYLPQYGRRRTKELCWGIRNNNLIRDYHGQLPDLEVLYRRQHVENLSVAHLTIWSSGSGPIRGNDIAPADPLVVEARQGTAILDVTAIGLNNPPSQLSIVPRGDGHVLEIAFDFLEHGQGGVFQIVHTGIAGFNLGVCGHIIGGNVRERWVDVDGLADLGNAASIPTSTKRFTMLGYGLFGLFTLLDMVHLEPVLLDSLNRRKQSGSGHFTPIAGHFAPIADLRLSSPIEPCLNGNIPATTLVISRLPEGVSHELLEWSG